MDKNGYSVVTLSIQDRALLSTVLLDRLEDALTTLGTRIDPYMNMVIADQALLFRELLRKVNDYPEDSSYDFAGLLEARFASTAEDVESEVAAEMAEDALPYYKPCGNPNCPVCHSYDESQGRLCGFCGEVHE